MGRVFVGVTPGGRRVAVKLVRPEYANDEQFRRRFAREVEAARKVGGFHTAQVVDADPDADLPWMALAYIPGPSLDEAVSAKGPFDHAGVLALGAVLAEGLSAIHACGLIHRDLKPGNVILADDGPRIVDFGLAYDEAASTITITGALMGTPAYMSPEQHAGLQVAPATDVFSLGAVLVFAATGHGPFNGRSIGELRAQVITGQPDLSGLTGSFRAIISRCLAKRPADRPTVTDLIVHFTGHVPARTVSHVPSRPAARASSGPEAAARPVGYVPTLPANKYNSTVTAEPKNTFTPDTHALEGIPASTHVRALAFSPDGRLLVAGANKGIHVWDTASGRAIFRPLSAKRSVRMLTFSSDGRHLLAVEFGGNTVTRWDIATGQPTGPPAGIDGFSLGLVSPGGRFATVYKNDGVFLWDLMGGSAKPRIVRKGLGLGLSPGSPYEQPTFSADGSRLAMAIGISVHVWDTASLRQAVHPLRSRGDVSNICFSPDGRFIATISHSSPGYRVCLWDISGRRSEAWEVDKHAELDLLPYTQVSPNSQVFAVVDRSRRDHIGGSIEGRAFFWDVSSRKSLGQIDISGPLSFSPDGNTVGAVEDGKVRLWDLVVIRSSPAPLADQAGSVSEIVFSRDWRLMATVVHRGRESSIVRLWRSRFAA